MTTLPVSVRWRAIVLVASALLFQACARTEPPEAVALEYGRAVYANDAETIWRLVSAEDRRVKDEATLQRQQRELRPFTREVVGRLASFITATLVKTAAAGNRATVTLTFRLPDANAGAIRALVHDWDEQRLDGLPEAERARIREHLDRLHRDRQLPTIEGDETIELVREAADWKVFLNWAGGVRVRFDAAVDGRVPLEVTITPASAVLAPGERLRVTVRARNPGGREVTTRVGHRIEPETHASYLALLQCPLFVPVTLGPGEAREFASEYLLLGTVPADAKAFGVTYRFPFDAEVKG